MVLMAYFYPRPPREGRLRFRWPFFPAQKFLPTPSARRATSYAPSSTDAGSHISTHALREKGDEEHSSLPAGMCDISTHALREKGDIAAPGLEGFKSQFLPTPSARRATRDRMSKIRRLRISTHALREKGDQPVRLTRGLLWNFYPRPPREGRRPDGSTLNEAFDISTHALREKGDVIFADAVCASKNFYPRPPREGRPGQGVV